jgi:glutathionylspermidine synthase
MRRVRVAERPGWRQRQEELGFTFHSIGGRYWVEDAAYELTTAEVDALEDATNELERICLLAVERVIADDLFGRLNIGPAAAALAKESWRRHERNIVGRFDLHFDGSGPPKLYEYNADTPTALFEASVAQWHWFEETQTGGDQFNSIHERLIAAWRGSRLPAGTVYFTCEAESAEDTVTTEYLRDTCAQAGRDTQFIALQDIGCKNGRFVDLADRPIGALFKLYPWEWLLQDAFGKFVAGGTTRFVEPAWKMVLSNKGILAMLWEMFPGHPNLLPASLAEGTIAGTVVRKPLLSREGANIAVLGEGGARETHGPYRGPYVWQAALPPPTFDGNHAVVGSWVIASQSAGIGIREDDGPITLNTSRFVPHYFR